MFKKILFTAFSAFSLFAMFCTLSSCSDSVATIVFVDFVPPDNAEISVRDIKVKGFTIDWTDIPNGDYESSDYKSANYEYAVAVTHDNSIGDYASALENNQIVLDFTPSLFLNGSYKITKLIPGKTYTVKLFVRADNIHPSEYLSTSASLPYIDDAEIINIWINDSESIYDKIEDSFSYYYLPGSEDDSDGKEFYFTYQMARGCALYIDGVKTDAEKIQLSPYVPLEVTAVNERTLAARDYTVYAGGRNNGIPIIILNTETGRSIRSKDRDVEAHLTIIAPDDSNPLGIGLYDGDILIRGRGNSSWDMPKKSYNFSVAEKTQILDMAPSTDWLLIANYTDKSLMRNYTAYEFSRDLGAAFAPKLRYIDLILNGDYVGTYCIGERVKIDKGRLDFPKIKADTTDPDDLTGTYVLEINNRSRLKDDEITFTSTKINRRQFTVWGEAEGDVVVVRQPGKDNLSDDAYEYIKDYFNQAEDALFSDNFKDPVTGYAAYYDVDSFIDWYLINELYKQVDGDVRLSTFLYKPRGGKLFMGPVWDFDLGAGNADYRSCDDPEGWYIRTSIWFTRFFEDEAFAQKFKDRWNYIKDNGYFDVFFQRIDDTAKFLENSAQMNFTKWRILGEYIWPNANNFWERTTYQSEIDYLKDWLSRRIEWMDKEINK